MKLSKKPIIITIDLHGCKYVYDVHQRLKEAFDFPDWYGRNWMICYMLQENIQLCRLEAIILFLKVLHPTVPR